MQVRRTMLLAVGVVLALVPGAVAAGEKISGKRALAFVRELATLGPRPPGSTTERRAADLVAVRLRSLGYRVFRQPFDLPGGGRSRNVVGLSRGQPRALVVAHLDGVSEGPAANDNASGVAVLLEVARALQGTPGVLVAALGAEERAETGSRLHLGAVRLLRGISSAGRRRIGFAVSLDMVGVGTDLFVRGIEEVPNRSARLALGKARTLKIPASYLPDPGWSDHAELSRGGLPATWLEWRPDACWHSACDRAARVRADRLVAAGRVTLAAARAALSRR